MPEFRILDDAIPREIALATLKKFAAGRYERVRQEFDKYYECASDEFPDPSETWTAEFSRAVFIEGGIDELYAPVVSHTGNLEASLSAVRMQAGDHYRVHTDSHMGSLAFTWYLSPVWKWDWGGLLLIKGDRDYMIFPTFNRLVLMPTNWPHCVTEIAPHAKAPRYSLSGFCK